MFKVKVSCKGNSQTANVATRLDIFGQKECTGRINLDFLKQILQRVKHTFRTWRCLELCTAVSVHRLVLQDYVACQFLGGLGKVALDIQNTPTIPLLDYKEYVVDNLVYLDKALRIVPRYITTLGAQWNLTEPMKNRSIHDPAFVVRTVTIVSETIHVFIIVAVNVLDPILIGIVDTFQQTVSIIIIVRNNNIAILVAYQTAFNPTCMVVVEKQSCVTCCKLGANSLGTPSVHVAVNPIFTDSHIVVFVGFAWVSTTK